MKIERVAVEPVVVAVGAVAFAVVVVLTAGAAFAVVVPVTAAPVVVVVVVVVAAAAALFATPSGTLTLLSPRFLQSAAGERKKGK